MRYVTEIAGAIVLLTIFAYGVKSTIKYFNRESTNANVPRRKRGKST